MRIERTSLRDAIYERLKHQILSHELPTNTTLSEPALAKEFGVSRSPLREALVALELEGLLSSTVNRGFRVQSLDERTIAEVYPIMGTLEGLAVRLSPDDLRERVSGLRSINEEIRAAEKPPEVMAGLDRRWHETLVGACDNKNLAHLVANLRGRIQLYDQSQERGLAAIEGSYLEHESILQAIEEGQFTRAARLLEDHWENGVRVVIDWLRERETT